MTYPTCHATGKARYPKEYDARVALVSCIVARNRGKHERREARIYHCPVCNGWHLTSRRK